MIIIILAGGSGTRLWPLSTPDFPKHLLSINGNKRSLLQLTYLRAKKISNEIYIVSDKSHIRHVKEQIENLDDSHFIVEPSRRGTANCMIFALSQINNKNQDETIAFIHSDHYIRDEVGFNHTFKVAESASKKYNNIILIGAEPDYPATGFGYIKKGNLVSDEPYIYKVDSFKEKPDFITAKQYLNSGKYSWNCGYFLAKLSTFENAMKEYSPNLYSNFLKLKITMTNQLEETYKSFKSSTIDYELIEKDKELMVIQASFDWMDLGSFSDLHKAVGSDENNNYIKGDVEIDEVENAFIQNETNLPMAVIGLDNIVVISTNNGILVTRKDLSQKVGEISKRINNK